MPSDAERNKRRARRYAREVANQRQHLPERRHYQRRVERLQRPIEGGNRDWNAGDRSIDEIVAEIGRKPCSDSPTGTFSGLPRYSAATVYGGVEAMSVRLRNLALRISSDDYRSRARAQGTFNIWWYHSQRVSRG
jgi:hypothetical protein